MKSRTNKKLCTKGGRDSHTVGLPTKDAVVSAALPSLLLDTTLKV